MLKSSPTSCLRDVPWEDVFKLGASAAAVEFCEWVQVEIDVYTLIVYQVKPDSSPWLSTAFAGAIVHRNHFFHLYQQNKSSESKIKFRQASNHCKKVHHFPETRHWGLFRQIANSVINKGQSAITPLFIGSEVLSSASDKAKLFAKKFSRNSNHDDSGISLPMFPSGINLKLHNISVTPKMVKKVKMNLDSSKVSSLILFQWSFKRAVSLNFHIS